MRLRALLTAAVVGVLVLGSVEPASAAFPGKNGKIAHASSVLSSVNPDGTDPTTVTSDNALEPAWSPDGTQLVYVLCVGPPPCSPDEIYKINADGTGRQRIATGGFYHSPTWSPDGRRIAYSDISPDSGYLGMYVMDADGSNVTSIVAPTVPTGYNVWEVAWSPDGSRIAFTREEGCAPSPCTFSRVRNIWVVDPDGTDAQRITNDPPSPDTPGNANASPGWYSPSWSPDGSRFAAVRSDPIAGLDVYTVDADGSNEFRLTQPPDASSHDRNRYAAWSPDGTRIAFSRQVCQNSPLSCGFVNFFTVAPDGSGLTQVPGVNLSSGYPRKLDWQPIPINSYARPKAATPTYIPLVTAYTPCATHNRVHAAPLSHSSCAPAGQTSSQLTVGTPDSNSRVANSTGAVRLRVVNDDTGTPADESDVALAVNMTDVRRKADLSDYTGELRLTTLVRATDKLNQPQSFPSGFGAATLQDVGFGPSVPCSATPDTAIGASCSVSTTVNSLIPGLVVGGVRANWELGQVRVFDGGADGDGDTLGDNSLFAVQGVFAP